MADNKKEYSIIYNDKNFYEYNLSDNVSYDNKKIWMNNFESIASKIINLFNPETVLDIGCAYGYLVEALRSKGVKAYGIDVSEYAVNQADENVKPFLKSMSALDNLPDNFPKHYDLVVSIEMIEHLYEDDGLKLIEIIASYTDKVLLSSTDSDFDNPTHFNVRPKEYWVEQFAKHNFLRNLEHNVTFISPNTYFFEKVNNLDISSVISHYEKAFKIVKPSSKGFKAYIKKLFNTKLLFIKPFVKKILIFLHLKEKV